jgi:hypothetical protein
MNERIEKLVRQAGLTQAKDFKSGDEVKNFVFGNGLEKFAELIVKECANRATWAQDTGAADIGGEVLKHFGVEE